MIVTPVATSIAAVVDVATSSLVDRRRFLLLAAATGAAVSGSALLPAIVRGVGSTGLGVPSAAATMSSSVVDVATSLDHDVERIFRFVSEEIRYEPYVGILRGANGALRGRAGNSADQALLLAELLKAGGTLFRFASGPIDDETAAAILGAAGMDRVTAQDEALRVLVTDAQSTANPGTPVASPDAEADALLATAEAEAPGIITDVTRRMLDDVATITGALEDAGITLPDSLQTLPGRELTQHIWVQVASGPDWLDLDPTLPTNPAGVSLTSADSTMDVLPDSLRHGVAFVAVAEQWTGGQLQLTTAFEYTTYADAIHGIPIAFTNAKSDDLGINIIGAVGGGTAQYVPVLEVGPKEFVGTAGLSFGAPGDGFFGEQTGEAVAGLLDGEASAEWLDVRVSSPDAAPTVARRTIFDRIGQVIRESGIVDPAAVDPIVLVDSGEAFGEYAPMMAVHAFSVVAGSTSGSDMIEPFKARRLGVYSWVVLASHYLRDALASEISTQQGAQMYLDGPGVMSMALAYDPVADPTITLSMDIWHRRFATLPITDQPAIAHPRVMAGVLSHVAERLSTGDLAATDSGGTTRPLSVGAIFQRARVDGTPIRALRGTLPAGSAYPPEAATLIAAALAAGSVVIVPEQAIDINGRPRLGWWIIDPATGATEDQLDDGGGQSFVEYDGGSMNTWVRAVACGVFVGEFIFGAFAVVSKILGGSNRAVTVGAAGTLAAKALNKVSPIFEKACVGK